MVDVVLMLVGRLFQATSPATLNARSQKIIFSVRLGMFSNPCRVDADHNAARFSPTTAGVHSSVRYSGSHAVERLEDGHAEFVLHPLGTSQPVEAITLFA